MCSSNKHCFLEPVLWSSNWILVIPRISSQTDILKKVSPIFNSFCYRNLSVFKDSAGSRKEINAFFNAIVLLNSVWIPAVFLDILGSAKRTFRNRNGIDEYIFFWIFQLLMTLLVMLIRFITNKTLRSSTLLIVVPGCCPTGLEFSITHGWWPIFRQTTKQATTLKS